MEKKMQTMFKKLASWLFLIGVLIAVIVGLLAQTLWPTTINATTGAVDLNYPTYLTIAIAALGFIVGILSFFALGQITKERIPTFLLGALILVMIGALSSTWTFGTNESMYISSSNLQDT